MKYVLFVCLFVCLVLSGCIAEWDWVEKTLPR